MGQREFRRHVRALERGLLRGPRLAGGLDGLVAALRGRDPRGTLAGAGAAGRAAAWLERLADAARPVRGACWRRPRRRLPRAARRPSRLRRVAGRRRDGRCRRSSGRGRPVRGAHQFVSELQLAGRGAGAGADQRLPCPARRAAWARTSVRPRQRRASAPRHPGPAREPAGPGRPGPDRRAQRGRVRRRRSMSAPGSTGPCASSWACRRSSRRSASPRTTS